MSGDAGGRLRFDLYGSTRRMLVVLEAREQHAI